MWQLDYIRRTTFKLMMMAILAHHLFVSSLAMAYGPDTGAGITGRWQNIDQDTGGIVELIVKSGNAGPTMLEISSACEPSPCRWNPIAVDWNGLFPFTVEYRNFFKLVILTFYTESDGFLYIHTANSFFDAPERDYEATFRMRRE